MEAESGSPRNGGYLDPVKYFTHHLDPLVLVSHLTSLETLRQPGDGHVDRDEEEHDQQSGQHARTQHQPQQVDGDSDLQGCAENVIKRY